MLKIISVLRALELDDDTFNSSDSALRLLSARREYVHTYFHANASGAEGERPRLRLRPYRSQPVL